MLDQHCSRNMGTSSVLVSESLEYRPMLTPSTGPTDIMFADKASIQKIIVDEDFRKSRDYEVVREDPHITSLITETDKVKYKQKVYMSSHRIYLKLK
jgi:hypothetical protein